VVIAALSLSLSLRRRRRCYCWARSKVVLQPRLFALAAAILAPLGVATVLEELDSHGVLPRRWLLRSAPCLLAAQCAFVVALDAAVLALPGMTIVLEELDSPGVPPTR
jgi:hypothetical protein